MQVALALVGILAVAAPLAAADQSTAPNIVPRTHAPQRVRAATLNDRVQLMAKELNLDAGQQVKLRTILEAQRDEVTRAWRDPSVPAPIRVSRTQSIGEQTAERIRAILNDDQRKKYSKAHQHETVGAPGTDVQKWMKSTEGQKPALGPARP